MLGDSKQASSATTSLKYLTLGALIDVWAIVYLFYLRSHDGSDTAFYWVYGFIFTGAALFLIGLAVGQVGRSARSAEVAPTPTQQIITTPAVSPVAPVTIAASANPPLAQVPIVRPAPVVATGTSTPAGSYALAGEKIYSDKT